MIYDLKLKIDGEERDFVFELTRASLVMAEDRGVNVFAMNEKPLKAITGFCYAGLQRHHMISWEAAQGFADEMLRQYQLEDLMIFMAEAVDSVFTSEGLYQRPQSRQAKAEEQMKKEATSKKSKNSSKKETKKA